MHFVGNKQDLLFAVQTVQRAVSLKSPQPILSGIKFETKEDLLITTATDLEMGIQCSTKVRVIEPGSAVLPAKYVSELIRRLPDTPIFFQADPLINSVTIKYGDSETNINGFPAEEYPSLVLPSHDSGFDIPESVFKDAIKQIIFAVGTDENRPVFTGAMFHINEDQAQIVATDMHLLAWRQIPLNNNSISDLKVIVPGKTLSELSKIIGKPEQQLLVTLTENQVMFATENISFISRLINGKFPPYRQVIPQNFVSKVRLKTQELLEAIERAALLATQESSLVKFKTEDKILIVSSSNLAGRIYEEIPIIQEGEPIQVAFNAHYLNNLLRVIGSNELDIEFSGPLSPGIFRPVGDEEYFSLLLPVRMKEEENV